MGNLLMVSGASLLGGTVQSVTGFGASIIIMIFLPVFLSMTAAPAVSDVITMTLSFITASMFPYMLIGIVAIQAGCVIGSRIANRISLETLKKSVYFLMIFAGAVSVYCAL
ncbi:MAG: hypothetical protein ACOX8K_03390 [Lachnospiraceae bacterium]|jgi:uncharacterized membrane protein YfcA